MAFRASETGIVAAEVRGGADMGDTVHEHRIGRHQPEPGPPETGRIERGQIEAPDYGNVDDEDCCHTECVPAAEDPLIDEGPEAVSRMLLDLVEHVARAVQEYEHQRQGIGCVQQWQDGEERRRHEPGRHHPMARKPRFQIPHRHLP